MTPYICTATSFIFCLALAVMAVAPARAEDGYDLWLRYAPVSAERQDDYRGRVRVIAIGENPGPTLKLAAEELKRGAEGVMEKPVRIEAEKTGGGVIHLVTPAHSGLVAKLDLPLGPVGPEGFVIKSLDNNETVIAGNSEIGVYYGVFHFLRLMQTEEDIGSLDVAEAPAADLRMLNHWDNLDRTVERGYAGQSLWDWHKLPDYIDPRYTDYARANASIGINAASLTNVNANAWVLTPAYIEKAAALADAFRPYGIRVFLTARFSAPIEIGGLKTADPLDDAVRAWWAAKADEIYAAIPDFGGFLVKANSEGQPGPQDYGRSHADGANMLADAVAPHGGVVIWRAFVYSASNPDDRAKQAYTEFVPLDGAFRGNVLIQVKNGPIDFQPREPFHPMFGAMPETPLMMEFQITKEYLGFATHLAYLAPLYEEVLDADTHSQGEGSTVARVIDGTLHDYSVTGFAGVSNIGSNRNWSGSHFDQANWYAFGRLAWDPSLSSERIAENWARMTFTNDDDAVAAIVGMMMQSREAIVDYMTPLGLTHLMATGHHYGPGPWVDDLSRPEWNPVYYHRADRNGIGFDRTASGSNAIAQYADPVAEIYGDIEKTPENLLLWFHHVPWDHRMASGETLWTELVRRYDRGVRKVEAMQAAWASLDGAIDDERFAQVADFLAIQRKEAQWWRDASIAYFRSVSGLPLPEGAAAPPHDLDHYKSLSFPYAPGH